MESFHKYNKILMPTDGSECSLNAAQHGLWIADTNNATIIVLHVVDTHVLQLGYSGFFREDLYNIIKKEGEEIIEKFKEKLKEHKSKCLEDIKLITKIRDGEPYDEILKTIDEENIDLVVIGASGKRGIDRLLLGSVTERVVRKSTVPVLVVH